MDSDRKYSARLERDTRGSSGSQETQNNGVHRLMRGEDKHDRIIKAAIKVFAKNGFYNSRVSEIAKEAQVADGTVYLYFKNKDDILIRLFEEEMDKIITNMKEEMDKVPEPDEKLRRFAVIHLNMVRENKSLAEVIQVELRQSSKFMHEYKNRKFIEYLNIISTIVKEGQRTGCFRPDIMPGLFKRSFFGALDELSNMFVFSTKRKYNVEMAADQVSSFFIAGLMPDENH
jgi:TetR/AcrR family transcriptional regulator, fatty acid metabolism regulator protein